MRVRYAGGRSTARGAATMRRLVQLSAQNLNISWYTTYLHARTMCGLSWPIVGEADVRVDVWMGRVKVVVGGKDLLVNSL